MFIDIVGYSALAQKNERQVLLDLDERSRTLLRSSFRVNDGVLR
jgi:hypothetical protein